MELLNSFKKKTIKVNSETFETLALEVFQYQAKACDVYAEYISHLRLDLNKINHLEKIPFLPINLFKSHKIKTDSWKTRKVFQSSGTMITGFRSKHHIEDVEYYLNNAQSIFENFYGPLEEKIFFALLPSYQEQGDSSLVQMVEFFIDKSGSFTNGGFYLNKTELLIADLLIQLENNTKQVILFGVGYALLDLAELASSLDVKLDGLTVIETGGMKGRRKDMVKEEFYGELKAKLGDIKIHSEYGMTELLSQAYSMNEKSFVLPDCMKILIRDSEDPFSYLTPGRAGGINVIDLANVHSCSFIETSDLGKILSDGTFTILGRLDNSDIRGCNLMIE